LSGLQPSIGHQPHRQRLRPPHRRHHPRGHPAPTSAWLSGPPTWPITCGWPPTPSRDMERS